MEYTHARWLPENLEGSKFRRWGLLRTGELTDLQRVLTFRGYSFYAEQRGRLFFMNHFGERAFITRESIKDTKVRGLYFETEEVYTPEIPYSSNDLEHPFSEIMARDMFVCAEDCLVAKCISEETPTSKLTSTPEVNREAGKPSRIDRAARRKRIEDSGLHVIRAA
jgi:hypothetical protein